MPELLPRRDVVAGRQWLVSGGLEPEASIWQLTALSRTRAPETGNGPQLVASNQCHVSNLTFQVVLGQAKDSWILLRAGALACTASTVPNCWKQDTDQRPETSS
jgi:hypothetical protein